MNLHSKITGPWGVGVAYAFEINAAQAARERTKNFMVDKCSRFKIDAERMVWQFCLYTVDEDKI